MKLAVIGLGKLGSPLAAVLASHGHEVVGADLYLAYVEAINAGKAPVDEPGLQTLIDSCHANLSATTDVVAAVAASEIVFVVVPTPSVADGSFTSDYAVKAAKKIGEALSHDQEYRLVVLVSTVMPGDTGSKFIPALEKASGKTCGKEFSCCYNPEFIALGSVIRDMERPDFVLIGESDERGGRMLEEHYLGLLGEPKIKRMSLIDAEITKLSLNCYVTTKMSFANQIGDLCFQTPGADANVVLDAIGTDSRIGRKYLKAATGWGGPCFPRDNRAMMHFAEQAGVTMPICSAVDKVNQRQTINLFKIVCRHTKAERPGSVAVLGITYKPDSVLVEESAGLDLVRRCAHFGYHVAFYDPKWQMLPNELLAMKRIVRPSRTVVECLAEAEVAVIATPWPEFANVRFKGTNLKAVIDPWGMVNTSLLGESVEYIRPSVGPKPQ